MSGYPEAHPDVIVEDGEQMRKNYWADIDYLKQKARGRGRLLVSQGGGSCSLERAAECPLSLLRRRGCGGSAVG